MYNIKMKKTFNLDWGQNTKQLRPQLYNYLKSVSHKIDGRSYQKFVDIFDNSNKPKLKSKYQELKDMIDSATTKAKPITHKAIKERTIELNKKTIERKTKAVDKIVKTLRNTVVAESKIVNRNDKYQNIQIQVVSKFIGKEKKKKEGRVII